MKRTLLLIGLALVVGLGSIALTADRASATTVCYALSGFSERLVLDVKSHSSLSSGQTSYSVHGKHVGTCGTGTMVSVTGTVSNNTKTSNPPVGSHMGLRVHTARSACIALTIECTSDNTKVPSKAIPTAWTCKIRQDTVAGVGGGALFSPVFLAVAAAADPLCVVFQDTGGFVEEVGEGTGTGLIQ